MEQCIPPKPEINLTPPSPLAPPRPLLMPRGLGSGTALNSLCVSPPLCNSLGNELRMSSGSVQGSSVKCHVTPAGVLKAQWRCPMPLPLPSDPPLLWAIWRKQPRGAYVLGLHSSVPIETDSARKMRWTAFGIPFQSSGTAPDLLLVCGKPHVGTRQPTPLPVVARRLSHAIGTMSGTSEQFGTRPSQRLHHPADC